MVDNDDIFTFRENPYTGHPVVQYRSYINRQRAFFRFVNRTHRRVDLIWINFSGNFEITRSLNPADFVDINTYKTHPWIAVDSMSKHQMNIEDQRVFISPACVKLDIERRRIVRDVLNIYLPVRSLKCTVMLNMVENKLVKKCEDVEKLELPRTLEVQLCEVLKRIERVQLLY